MARRMNVSGFSMARMRDLLGSGDDEAIERIRIALSAKADGRSTLKFDEVMAIVERAIREGVPFPELDVETFEHEAAATALASDRQIFVTTAASSYPAEAFIEGIFKPYGRIARQDVGSFLRSLAYGVPMFGQATNRDEASPYAAIGRSKLQALRGGLVHLREQIVYRIARRKVYDKDRAEDVGLIADFFDSIDQIIDAEHDLWFRLD